MYGHDQVRHSPTHAVALVALGNPLRGDDAIASHLLAGLPPELSEGLCLLDAGCYTRDLPAFLHGHRLGIIVDAAQSVSGEVVVVDLSDVTQRQKILPDCSHAFSWLDEIVLYHSEFNMPKRMLFVGIPTHDTGFHAGLSEPLQEKLPVLSNELCQLIERERENNA